jgi:hypothetical protein
MSGKWLRVLRAVPGLGLSAWLAGCSSVHIGNIKMPLADAPAPVEHAHVTIDDQRPPEDRKVHMGRTFNCERWYGDDSYVPDKLSHLHQLIAARTTEPLKLVILLFHTVEYCENTQRQLTQTYWRTRRYSPGDGVAREFTEEEMGDRFELRVGGTINGKAFAIVRGFVYRPVAKHGLVELPGTKPEYLAELRKTFEVAADAIVAKAKDGS